MTYIEDRPTIAEQYAKATGTSDLSTGRAEGGRVAIDYLGAAAWAGNDVGRVLFHLRREYEEVRAEHQAAERMLREREQVAAKLRRSRSSKLDEQARRIEEAAKADAVAARALILVRLKSLPEAKELLKGWAISLATKRRFMKPDKVVIQLVGRVLGAWLDELCQSCGGTGLRGGYSGEAQTICRACGGTGKRAHSIGKDDAERQFAGLLLCEMDRAVADFSSGMRRRL